MKVYIQTGSAGTIQQSSFFEAWRGFRETGLETVLFQKEEMLKDSAREDVIVGYVDTVRRRLADFGIMPPEMDYPKELGPYLGRRIWESRIDTVNAHPEQWPVFVKPVEDKKFAGVIVRSPKDLMGCGTFGENPSVYCSEVVSFAREWRVFVRYGKIIDVRPYQGDWHMQYDPETIDRAVAAFLSAPAGYAIDFGVTDTGRTLMIEVNDGYALGSYGLYYPLYAKLLSARWAELTGTEDACDFENEALDYKLRHH